jgi:TetR/AcrR family transcriptional regulator, regulator of biofilm formation and stress response
VSSALTSPPRTEPRGAARRRALLEAAVRVIGRGGIAAADHRAVAAEAGVPLGSTTYYFESKDDMVAQALHYVADREAERLGEEIEGGLLDARKGSPAERLADLMIDVWAGDRTVLLAQYELYLESARREDLRPAAERWDNAYREFFTTALDQLGVADSSQTARLLCCALDGLLLDHVATDSAPEDFRELSIEAITRIVISA